MALIPLNQGSGLSVQVPQLKAALVQGSSGVVEEPLSIFLPALPQRRPGDYLPSALGYSFPGRRGNTESSGYEGEQEREEGEK